METVEEKLFVYVGQIVTTDNRLSFKYYEIDAEGKYKDGRTILLAKSMGRHSAHSCGAIYRCKVTNDESFSVGSATYQGMYNANDEVLEWGMKSRATASAFKQKKIDKAEMNENPMYKSLEKVRQIYRTTHTNQRPFMLGQIIEYITR